MKQSVLFAPTLREVPADTEAASHRLMIKGGFIRQMAAGVYTYLPLGRRVLRKVEAIVREEMDLAGAQELLMPALQPVELLKESGRYAVYGPELFRLQDRHGREFALGPTHEEVITTLIGMDIRSYRKLPVALYQIQTKFRDERRPRFGLLRGREFLMKDAYSFNADWEGMDRAYQGMVKAYRRIFARCGLDFLAVEADSGSIGGEGGSHEFMAVADSGEDTVVHCSSCGYAANLEKAEAGSAGDLAASSYSAAEVGPLEKFHTPGLKTIEDLVDSLGIEPDRIIKTLLFLADGKPVAVLVRGDHEVSETKVKGYLGAEILELAETDTVRQLTGAPTSFAGPVGLNIPILVDREAAALTEAVTGAGEQDYHWRHVVPGRDFPLSRQGDFRNVREGEPCPRCSMPLRFTRGIEIGHVFKLGTKYSAPLGARIVTADGEECPVIMGCYGIGISRLLAAIIEQSHDGDGMIWPPSVAPYHVHLIPVSMADPQQKEAAEKLYDRLHNAGLDVLLDDREERAGVKFKDADLIGLPIRIIIGKAISRGIVEYKERRGESKELPIDEAVDTLLKVR